jgi:hypothetical protein
VASFTPRPLYPQEKSPWYPLDRRVGGPQSRSGRGGEDSQHIGRLRRLRFKRARAYGDDLRGTIPADTPSVL